MKTLLFSVVMCGISIILSGCGIKIPKDSAQFYRVTSPDQRVNDQMRYFQEEYVKISNKRGQQSNISSESIKPEKLVGLGLSGGGIRSAAYQLGLLAGLQSTNVDGTTNALDKVDYLSCVSGGCWAAGAFLIAKENSMDFFDCLNEQASAGKVNDQMKCARAKSILRNKQTLELAENNQKEKWEEEIRDAYFPNECREFAFSDQSSTCWENLKGKPQVIFNMTHSTLSPLRFGANKENFPFQITPNQLGTIVDCGSIGLGDQECGQIKGQGAGKDKVGFFVMQNANNFKWVRRERSGKFLWLFLETTAGSQMSKAMAHASAVVGTPKVLSFSMGLTYLEKFPKDEIRDNYFLTDGGFTENLGLLSLVERGVDFIILSDMGYPERAGDDLQQAAAQVNKLLKCDITGIENLDPRNLISTLHYSCPNVPKERGTGQGIILYVRPYPDNIEAFKSELQSTQKDLFDCIEDKTHRCYGESPFNNPDVNAPLESKYQFPQTNTMLLSYDERLIRSYYLLGKYISEHYISSAIVK